MHAHILTIAKHHISLSGRCQMLAQTHDEIQYLLVWGPYISQTVTSVSSARRWRMFQPRHILPACVGPNVDQSRQRSTNNRPHINTEPIHARQRSGSAKLEPNESESSTGGRRPDVEGSLARVAAPLQFHSVCSLPLTSSNVPFQISQAIFMASLPIPFPCAWLCAAFRTRRKRKCNLFRMYNHDYIISHVYPLYGHIVKRNRTHFFFAPVNRQVRRERRPKCCAMVAKRKARATAKYWVMANKYNVIQIECEIRLKHIVALMDSRYSRRHGRSAALVRLGETH